MNYLEALLPDKRTDVILAGYQAHGTLRQNYKMGKIMSELIMNK